MNDHPKARRDELALLVEERTLNLAREKERAERAREEAERLLAATTALSTAADLPDVLDRILAELERVIPYDSASVQEVHGDVLTIIGARGFPDARCVLGHRIDLSSGDYPNLSHAVRNRAPVILEDAWHAHPGFRKEPHAQAAVRSWLGVPLLFGDRCTGLLTLDKREPGFYTGDNARLAAAFAAQASIAIENARLYTAAQEELTERRHAQDELERSEARYRDLVEHASDLIYRTDTASRITYANPTAQAVFGSESTLLGKSTLAFVRPDWREKATDFYVYQLQNRIPHTRCELPIVAKDGREIWMECSVQMLFENGEPVAFQAINRNVTERKWAEDALRASEERTRAIIQMAHNAFIAMNADGRILEWNPKAEKVFGWSRTEALGRSLSETIIPPTHREAHARGLERFLATGEGPILNRTIEISALHRSGREIPVELTVSFVVSLGKPVFHAFARDLTDRKLLETLREDLTQTMVHDLRTPLTSIMGALELLLAGPGAETLSEGQHRVARIAEANGRRLLGLVNAILDVTRLESGAVPLEREWVRLPALVSETFELQRPVAEAKRLRLVDDTGSELPAAWVDRTLIGRVLQNLVGNAVRFTPARGVILVLAALDPETPATLRVSVKDSGPGIPGDLRGQLFRKFVTGGQQGRGSGLGLAYCRLAVEAHGGKIWLEGEDGAGATVSFTLPMAPADLSIPAGSGPAHT